MNLGFRDGAFALGFSGSLMGGWGGFESVLGGGEEEDVPFWRAFLLLSTFFCRFRRLHPRCCQGVLLLLLLLLLLIVTMMMMKELVHPASDQQVPAQHRARCE